ncbi:hypothetical protein I204_05845 [Kwoniella mangroviensis CBS 8886]|nr:hypothetical protein I204_05845 [Kwoniella mangroviensis CBS 8886]
MTKINSIILIIGVTISLHTGSALPAEKLGMALPPDELVIKDDFGGIGSDDQQYTIGVDDEKDEELWTICDSDVDVLDDETSETLDRALCRRASAGGGGGRAGSVSSGSSSSSGKSSSSGSSSSGSKSSTGGAAGVGAGTGAGAAGAAGRRKNNTSSAFPTRSIVGMSLDGTKVPILLLSITCLCLGGIRSLF